MSASSSASAVAYIVIPAIAALAHVQGRVTLAAYLVVAVAALVLGCVFPLVVDLAMSDGDDDAGARVSYVYAGNIAGAALGGLSTGFALLDVLPLPGLSAALTVAGVVCGAVLAARGMPRGRRESIWITALLAAAVVVGAEPVLYRHLYEKLYAKASYDDREAFAAIYESKSGVVTVTPTGTVLGDGFYDGAFNTNPLPNDDVNRVVRAYALPLFASAPRSILLVGLGSGSWLQVLANLLDAIASSPAVKSALRSPKVTIVVDDGRRFLRRSDERYDVIVQNTTGYWRAHVTNLLSQEYFAIVKAHLADGGVLFLNSTSSPAAQRTVASAFTDAARFENMMLAGDAPIVLDRERWRRAMSAWRIDGVPVARSIGDVDAIEKGSLFAPLWRGVPTWEDRAAILARTASEPIVTDDNMATEWLDENDYPPAP